MKIPFFSSLHRGTLMAVFDIGSGSVGGAIVEERGQRPLLIHTSLRLSVPHEKRTEEQLATVIAQKTAEVAEKLLTMHAKSKAPQKSIRECLVVVHVPWVHSFTHVLEAPLKAETRVIEDMIVQLSHKALPKKAEDERIETFEKSVVRVELNGYPTSNPIGKKAKHIGVVVLETEMLQQMKKRLTNSLGATFPGVTLLFRSSTLVDSTLMRRRAPQLAHFTIADVTSEATSITIIRGGVVVDQRIVPVGFRSILRTISKEKGSTEDDIQSRIRMLMKDMCSTDECRSLTSSLDAVGAQFTKDFGNVFAEMGKVRKLPNTLVVRCHPDLLKWFTAFFARLDFAQFTETTQPFSVGEITAGAIAEHVVFTPGNTLDAGIATSCAFLYTGRRDAVGNLET